MTPRTRMLVESVATFRRITKHAHSPASKDSLPRGRREIRVENCASCQRVKFKGMQIIECRLRSGDVRMTEERMSWVVLQAISESQTRPANRLQKA